MSRCAARTAQYRRDIQSLINDFIADIEAKALEAATPKPSVTVEDILDWADKQEKEKP
jgi:hypothetical protein